MKLEAFNILTDERREIPEGQVRWERDGVTIEVTPTETGVTVRVASNTTAEMRVVPVGGNMVRITTDVAEQAAIHERAHRLYETHKANENSPMRNGR